jgi:AraC-like DNA-binding protein
MKGLTGEGPGFFIRRLRLERGAQLLARRAGSVSEIAYRVGFKRHGHFSHLFRKTYGVSPRDYARLRSN